MKKLVYIAAIILVTITITGTVKSSANTLAMTSLLNVNLVPFGTLNNITLINSLRIEFEESLELEDWMFEENNFGTFVNIQDEMEAPLELEDWMTNETFFDANSMFSEIEIEKPIELEDWMFEENNFGTFVNIQDEMEAPLELEDWMTNETIWN